MFARNFVKQTTTTWNKFRTMSTKVTYYHDKCMSTYAQKINLYNDDNTMNTRNFKLYTMCQKIAKEHVNYVFFRKTGELDKLTEEEMTQLILCCSNDNWKSFNYFKNDDIPEANNLLKDFKFVCKMVIQDYRSTKYVVDYFKHDKIAMEHLKQLNKNIGALQI